jgi:micrococcal nuclease
MGQLRLGLVVALVVLAGCTGNVALTEETESTSTAGSVSGAGPTPVPTADSFRGTVVNVVDGDTVDVRLQDGTEERIRLLGVDTPEVRGENDPADFPGVPDTPQGEECLRDAGVDASEFARSRLLGEEVQVVFDEQSDRRGGFGRLLAYIFVDGANFNYQLVAEGHATIYETQFTYLEQFETVADDARTGGIGLWRCRTSGTEVGQSRATIESDLVVEEIHEDAEGNDNENLNDEYVVFENTGDDPLDLTGWSLHDEADHVYAFPDGFVLDAGARVTVYTGSGQDTATALYWGATGAIWNNGGDTVIVENQDGAVVIEREYA